MTDSNTLSPIRVLIADADSSSVAFLTSELSTAGYCVVSTADDGASMLRSARRLQPDIVILDSSLSEVNGESPATVLHEESIAPVIIVTGNVTPQIVRNAAAAMASAVLLKPVQTASLIPALEVAVGQWQSLIAQKERVVRLREKDEARDLVLRAKRILIDTQGMSETEAYRTLRDRSMNTRQSMKAVAEAMLKPGAARQCARVQV